MNTVYIYYIYKYIIQVFAESVSLKYILVQALNWSLIYRNNANIYSYKPCAGYYLP